MHPDCQLQKNDLRNVCGQFAFVLRASAQRKLRHLAQHKLRYLAQEPL